MVRHKEKKTAFWSRRGLHSIAFVCLHETLRCVLDCLPGQDQEEETSTGRKAKKTAFAELSLKSMIENGLID